MYEEELRKKQQICVRLESENRALENRIKDIKPSEISASEDSQVRKRLESELSHLKSVNADLAQMERVKNEQVRGWVLLLT